MTTRHIYSRKAQAYARYRWDYAPEAIETLIQITGINQHTCLADIGAGTGILTRHFVDIVGRLFAVEINAEMRQEAALTLKSAANCTILAASAEATQIPTGVVDVITAAQAIQWFDPVLTLPEFRRILKPGGWLALLRNSSSDPADRSQAMEAICTAENGVNLAGRTSPPYPTAPNAYFSGDFQTFHFPFAYRQGWEAFIGAICSTSYMPDPSHPAFPRFEQAARSVFDRFSQAGLWDICGETELIVGRLASASAPGL